MVQSSARAPARPAASERRTQRSRCRRPGAELGGGDGGSQQPPDLVLQPLELRQVGRPPGEWAPHRPPRGCVGALPRAHPGGRSGAVREQTLRSPGGGNPEQRISEAGTGEPPPTPIPAPLPCSGSPRAATARGSVEGRPGPPRIGARRVPRGGGSGPARRRDLRVVGRLLGGAGGQPGAGCRGARRVARLPACPAGTERGCRRGRLGAELPTHSSCREQSSFQVK